jgi:hypothetical protein
MNNEDMSMKRVLLAAAVLAAALMPVAPASAANGAPFEAGAAIGDFTPPAISSAPNPADCVPVLDSVFNGPRPFVFAEPYIDRTHVGHYVLGDPFLDCNLDGRWDGNLLGGGGNTPRFYTHVADPVTARAVAVEANGVTQVVEVVDQEGLFDVYQQRIRAIATATLAAQGKTVDQIFISATHDESAPDSLGLGGINQVTSGVNQYFVDYLVQRSADAIVHAVLNLRPAHLRFAEAIEPANLRQCWSSYPFVDDQLMPTMQAVGDNGHVIATLTSVSQHAETLGFNSDPIQANWITADWPNFFRQRLQQRYGGVAIEMAGSVGSNETPQVFPSALSRVPQQFIDASHPAGCRTLFKAAGAPTPTGYNQETRQLGQDLANAVGDAIDTSAQWSTTNTMWGARTTVCVPLSNLIFAVGAVAGVFAERPAFVPGCVAAVPALPTGQAIGTSIRTEVAAFRIGDGEFASVPGEVFPFTYLGSFLGPSDLQYPQYPMTPMLMPHMHTPYRFIDGLAEDMIGYIFPQGNAVGIPGEHPLDNSVGTTDRDRFGCGHSDDSESASSHSGDLVGAGIVELLDAHGAPEPTAIGRYVLPSGRLSRDPLGTPDSLQCSVNVTFARSGPATRVWLATSSGRGQIVVPARWLSLSGRPQDRPDRNTRGWVDARGGHHWLDVFPDISGAPSRVAP